MPTPNSPYTLHLATPPSAPAIAAVLAQSWTSPFTHLQFGRIDALSLAAAMTPRIESKLETSTTSRTVSKIVAVAQWTLPAREPARDDQETPEEREERQRLEDEMYRNSLPEGSNKDLVMEFTLGLRELRAETLKGRPHYLLENIATLPGFRGKGLASRLLEWAFPLADEEGVLVYLDTAEDNPAMRLYKRLGFEERGRHSIENLERFWGKGVHTHVALVREPKRMSG
ncbi:hypothetical protein CC80DRAFT_527831 [Byssothecium circinans]|uniref:N-acetyltransferase domain-containing protein n=1 Tax=Byssothecium circinans TaxID=147558 RepID=A0A6A5TKY8_9PLEO|nr:hypothetical protein CC80DRAFT_527831 [Byssothecium circinans]